MSEYAAKRYLRNKKLINQANKSWYAANREKRLAAIKATRQGEAFKIKNRIYAANRRSRTRMQSDGTVTYDAIMQLLEDQNWKCNLCCADLRTVQKHLDHIDPLFIGGFHSISNVQWLCKSCNLSKGWAMGYYEARNSPSTQ